MTISGANPISVKSLWENCWVFALYGLCIGLYSVGSAALKQEINVKEITTLMTEPIAFYTFGTLSLVGLIGLGLLNLTIAKSAEAMHSCKLAIRVFVPIANAGLATGAIAMGMMFGLAVGFWLGSTSDAEVRKVVTLLFAMSGVVFAILFPLTSMKRSLFDRTKQEERASACALILYCAALSFAFWWVDQILFWKWALAVIGCSLFVGFAGKKLSRKRR